MRVISMVITGFIGSIIYITGMFIQKETTKGVFFGVRTPEKFLQRYDLKALEKEYKKNWSITWILSMIFTLLCIIYFNAMYSVGVSIIYCFGVMGLLNVCYYKTHKKVKVIKAKEDWSEHFTNNRIVVVDLKKEEQQKKLVKLFWIPMILIMIWLLLNIVLYINMPDSVALHINSSGVIDRWGQKGTFNTIFEKIILMPMVSTLFTVFFWGMNKIIYAAKNHINGGNVNEIMEQKRQFRKVGTWIFIVCNIEIVVIMAANNIMSFLNKVSGVSFYIFTVLTSLLPIILIIFYSYKIGQGGSNIKIKGKIEGNSLIINRDDDENYVCGSFYYNKEDPALFVEKRIGFGWDLNFGNKKAKWFMIPIATIVILVLFMMIYSFPAVMKPRDINLDEKSITISGTYGESINRNNIEKITLEDMPKILARTNGASTDNMHYGYYKIDLKDVSVKAKLYIENDKEKVILIETNDGKVYAINRKNIEDTKELYNKIK